MPDTQRVMQSDLPNIKLEPQSSSDSSANIKANHLQEAFEQFTRMSESFVHSYQDLEDQVEDLASRLSNEVAKKKQQLKEKEQVASRLQGLLSILPSGVVVLDGFGKVQDCNKVAIELLGRPLIGEPWLAIINRCFSPRFDDGYEVSLKDGRRIHIETRALETEPGQLIVLTDLTETRKLQDQVNQDKRLSSMGRMMASLAHQIRTPLASATLYAESLASESLPKNKRQQFGNKLMSCLGHLERHINDMLQFAKSGGLKRTSTTVEELNNALVEHLTNIFPRLKVAIKSKLSHESLKQLMINTDALKSALANLVDNAYQASSEDNQEQVTLTIQNNTSGWSVIVADAGKGMSETAVEKIFDPFYTTKTGGTGLGLAVVHGVVKAHDGKIKVKSKLNQGTSVTIDIPYALNDDSEIKNVASFRSSK